MKIALTSLALQGFRSFAERAELSFPSSGLVLLEGASGSGKSSLLMAISYALGYAPYAATDLRSWHTDADMKVEVTLDNGGPVVVTRGQENRITIGGGVLRGATAINDNLPKALGMNMELLAALTYRPQKTPGLFLSKTNSEMQAFLTTLLGLERYEAAIEESQGKLKPLADHQIICNDEYLDAKRAFDDLLALPDVFAEDLTPFKTLVDEAKSFVEEHKAIVDRMEAENAAYKSDWSAALGAIARERDSKTKEIVKGTIKAGSPKMAQLVALRNQCHQRLEKAKAAWKKRLADAHNEQDELYGDIGDLKAKLKKEPALRAEASRLEAHIETLKNQTCPTCQQPWNDAQDTLDRMEKTLALVYEELQGLPFVAAKADEISNRLAELDNIAPDPIIGQLDEMESDLIAQTAVEQAAINSENTRIDETYNAQVNAVLLQYEKRINQYNAIHQVEYDAKQRILDLARKDYDNAKAGLEKAQEALREAKYRSDKALDEITRRLTLKMQLDVRLTAATDALSNAINAHAAEMDFLDVTKNFLTAIFDEVLEEIAWNTNEMLRYVPNVAHVSVKFKSQVVTQKGTVKRAIVPFVVIDGQERNPKTALSGGMSTAVELAVDLAVRKVIAARTGTTPGWVVLDECFEGLGVAEKEAAMELLKAAAQDTLIIVVDHMSEFREMFSQRYIVTSENGKSKVSSEN